MSASVLREAASLMRERAEAATGGPWVADRRMVVAAPGPNAKYVADCFDEPVASDADAEHIASWHPAVALAVADWLEDEAFMHDNGRPMSSAALATATAYLGNPT